MKLKVIHDEVLKQHFKEGRILMGHFEDKIVVSPDGFKCYLVPEKDFVLDIDKILAGRGKFKAKEIFKGHEDAERVVMTNEMKQVDKKTLVKIDEKWVDKSLLKAFEPFSAFATMKSYSSPIYVYENGELVGLVMPHRVKGGDSHD